MLSPGTKESQFLLDQVVHTNQLPLQNKDEFRRKAEFILENMVTENQYRTNLTSCRTAQLGRLQRPAPTNEMYFWILEIVFYRWKVVLIVHDKKEPPEWSLGASIHTSNSWSLITDSNFKLTKSLSKWSFRISTGFPNESMRTTINTNGDLSAVFG